MNFQPLDVCARCFSSVWKSTTGTFLVVFVLSAAGRAELSNGVPVAAHAEAIQSGTSVVALAEFTDALKKLIPVGSKIISLKIRSEAEVVVTTGKDAGPLSGGGETLTLLRKDGKWRVAERAQWIR